MAASPTVMRGRASVPMPSVTLPTSPVGHSPSSSKDQPGVSAVTSVSPNATGISVGAGVVATGVGVGLTLVVLALAAVTAVVIVLVCCAVKR